jgi:Mg2+ and Co2+ transporter CorA
MIKQLDEAIGRLRKLPEERQQAAAVLLLDFLDHDAEDIELTPEQIAEIEAALADDERATDEEVEAFFARLRK